jgi:hypothetical protein
LIFPEIKGKNLENVKYTIPSDLEGDLNLIIIPFQQWHQSLVDQWVPFLDSMKLKNSRFRYYEMPTLNESYISMRYIIDGGMRAGIPDRSVRERTITLYINKFKFKQSLGIKSEETIYLYLVDKKSIILWMSEGKFDGMKGESLEKKLKKLGI